MQNALVPCICVLIAAVLIYRWTKSVAVQDIHELSSKLDRSIRIMDTARCATDFVDAYKARSASVKRLMSLRDRAPTQELRIKMDECFRIYERIPDEENQILLRNAIIRQKDDAIADIKWGARKTERQKKKIYDLFVSDLEKASWFFSGKTPAFADSAIDEVRLAAGLTPDEHPPFATRS